MSHMSPVYMSALGMNMQGSNMEGENAAMGLAQSLPAPQSMAAVKKAPPVPSNLFHKLQKAILAVQAEGAQSQVKALCSLVDKMTPRLFLKAC